jgi:2-keto-4-pentenoate hydratase/2-oxohepta-3-ene-1,7-dioic acid hydratase in catechol pathway
MKLARRGPEGAEVPVMERDGVLYRVPAEFGDVDGAFLSADAPTRLSRIDVARLEPFDDADARWGAPIARPGKIVCIGLNYRDHAAETGAAIPAEPVVFMKDPSTVVGPFDTLLVPRGSTKTDFEVELAVVIGRTARYLDSVEEAMACVAGYTVSNDVSEREFQLERGGQWDKGKSCETFNPCGPWLVPADEIADVQSLALWTIVNGEERQRGTTADMVFPVAEVVRYLSQFMVLHPGDVINTGTPAGVALGEQHPRYLRAGDEVELGIEGLGVARQPVGAA